MDWGITKVNIGHGGAEKRDDAWGGVPSYSGDVCHVTVYSIRTLTISLCLSGSLVSDSEFRFPKYLARNNAGRIRKKMPGIGTDRRGGGRV